MWGQIGAALLVAFAAGPASAQEFFRCVGENGRITYQGQACGAPRAAVAKTCDGLAANSHEQVQCLAASACDAIGAFGSTRSSCMKREVALQSEQAEQRREAERASLRVARAEEDRRRAEEQRKARELHREPVQPADPFETFVVGGRWESDALVKTLERYGAARSLTDQGFLVTHAGQSARVQTRKVSTGVAVPVYEVVEVKAELVPAAEAARAKPDCPDAKPAKAGGWIWRPGSAASAPQREDCERK